MSIRFHLVEPGMMLWQKKRQKMGNVNMSRDAWFPVRIIEKHEGHCLASWNGNPPRRVRAADVEKLYRQRPQKKTQSLSPINPPGGPNG